MNKNSLQQALQAASGAKNVPIAELTSDLDVAVMLSKMVSDPTAAARARHLAQFGPDQQMMRTVSNDTAAKITDARNFLQLLPDVKMGIEILVSSVLAPKDMVETSVSYSSATPLLPADVLATLNGIADEYFVKDYKITPQLPQILREILAETGSYAIAVLPENTVDDLINNRDNVVSLESYRELETRGLFDPIGILGPSSTPEPTRRSFSFESYQQAGQLSAEQQLIKDSKNRHLFISVTDNPNVIKRGIMANNLATRKREELLGIGTALESYTGINLTGTDTWSTGVAGVSYHKPVPNQARPLAIAKTQEQLTRKAAGQSLKLHVPSESLIPVFTPGDPSNHLGYYALLDMTGNFLSLGEGNDYYGQLKSAYNSHQDANSSMVKRITTQYENVDFSKHHQIDNVMASYAAIVENDLIRRLNNGIVGGEVKIGNVEAAWQIMLSRTFRQQYTQLVYLPKELLTYMAIDYNENGIGKSLLEDMRILLGLRVVLTFANTMASVRNSINRTQVNVKLDEHDVDPWKTMETVMAEINRSRAGFGGVMPIGNSAPVDVVDYLARAGYEFTFEGHPGMPDVKVDFNEKTSNHSKVDTDLEDHLAKRSAMSLSVPPEAIDNTFGPEFARSVTANHLMLAKRSIQIQDIWTPQLSQLCRNVLRADSKVISQLAEVITANIDNIVRRLVNKEEYRSLTKDTVITDEVKQSIVGVVLRDYIDSFEVSLSRPNSAQLDNQKEEFDTYAEALDNALTQIFDTSFANSDTMGELGDQVDLLKETAKAMLMRDWMAQNNYMSEVFEFVTEDENGKINRDLYEGASDHVAKLTKAVARFLKALRPNIEASNTYAEANQIEEPENSGSSDTGGEDDSEGGGGDDFGGDDDFGFGDDDAGAEDETTEETTEEDGEADTGDTGEGEATEE